jgi:transposase
VYPQITKGGRELPGRRISDDKKVVVKSLVDAGMSYQKVSEIVGVAKGSITNIVREFEASRELVAYYEKNRSDLLAHDQIVYRSYITPDKLEKASARDLEIMRGVCYDKERLERGKSTENVSAIVEMIRRMKEEEALEGERQRIESERDKQTTT